MINGEQAAQKSTVCVSIAPHVEKNLEQILFKNKTVAWAIDNKIVMLKSERLYTVMGAENPQMYKSGHF